ncbi:hypothetical protein LC085_00605 [Bacillus tianshenii]|uniref:hypothetical protein n=1 Tax=Sutcliffiella tianshenii TaxID=1463404 RepID=UPI001CD28969|nr:hypothetical protein [Bacillus tianshenii]MCA1318394.1 hypothetical protein [Bacillus tianshenii]
MKTQAEAVLEAFKALENERSTAEIREWVTKQYGEKWKDFGTTMADMVPRELGGNNSSTVPTKYRQLERVRPGVYRLIGE